MPGCSNQGHEVTRQQSHQQPQDVSIALDFLAQETQVSHAYAKRSSTRGAYNKADYFSLSFGIRTSRIQILAHSFLCTQKEVLSTL